MVLVPALGLFGKGGVLGGNAGELVMCGELTFKLQYLLSFASQCPLETLALGRIQTLSFSTAFIKYSSDWLNRNSDR